MNRNLSMFFWKLECAWCDVKTAFKYLAYGTDHNGQVKGTAHGL